MYKKIIIIIALILSTNSYSDVGSDGTDGYMNICSYVGSDGTDSKVGSDGTDSKVGSDGTDSKVGSDGTDSKEDNSNSFSEIVCQIIKVNN